MISGFFSLSFAEVENLFHILLCIYVQGRARFSFMGGKGGSLWKQVTFRLSDERLTQTVIFKEINITYTYILKIFHSFCFDHFIWFWDSVLSFSMMSCFSYGGLLGKIFHSALELYE